MFFINYYKNNIVYFTLLKATWISKKIKLDFLN